MATNPDDPNYILCRLHFARTALQMGCHLRAAPALADAIAQFDRPVDNTAAALGSESAKFYRGESYERAMACAYMGYMKYLDGDYENSRIYCQKALEEDRGSLMNEKTPSCYGEDFGLAYYWLARALNRLNDKSNCRIAATRAATGVQRQGSGKENEVAQDRQFASHMADRRLEGENWLWKTLHDLRRPIPCEGAINLATSQPAEQAGIVEAAGVAGDRSEFFSPSFQARTNLVIQIELGECPMKTLAGLNAERVEIVRRSILPYHVTVSVDGRNCGQAYCVTDLWDQATTQDRNVQKDSLQAGKSILKEILSHAPYVSYLAGHWQVSGDIRHWSNLPGRIYIFAAQVPSGVHSVRLALSDIDGRPLPRWTCTYYGIHVGPEGETCLLLNPHYDFDNVLSAEERLRMTAAGADGLSEDAMRLPGSLTPVRR